MLNAMKNENTDFEKLDFLFWKSRDKKFVLQPREGTRSDATDLAIGTRIGFFPGTIQTGWVKWANKVPSFENDMVAGIEDNHPALDAPETGTRDDPWKRFASINVEIDGNKRQFSAEGVTAVGIIADLLVGVKDAVGIDFDRLGSEGLTILPNFEVTYDGMREFDSKAGSLGKPVWADLEVVDTTAASSPAESNAAPSAEKDVDNLPEDDIPF